MMRSMAAIAGAALIAAMATPAAAQDVSFLFDADSGKGLLTLDASQQSTELSFHLFGLRAKTKYRAVVSSESCRSTAGTIVSRGFTTNARGFGWDPIPIASSAAPKTARIVRVSNGKTVACSTSVRTGLDVSTIKIDSPKKGLLEVAQDGGQARITLSVSQLRRSSTYRVVALGGLCARTSPVLLTGSLSTDSAGSGLVQVNGAAASAVGAVALRAPNGKVVFCRQV